MGWSLMPPPGFANIRLSDLQDCRCENDYHYVDGKALRSLMAKKGLNFDFSAPSGQLSFDEAMSVINKFAQEGYERAVLDGRVRISKREADEIMRYGSNQMKEIAESMKGNYGVDTCGFYSGCIA